MQPVYPSDAPQNVKKCYDEIQRALEVPQLPLFFAYLGAFPEYLEHITGQLVDNFQETKFSSLTSGVGEEIVEIIHSILPQSEESTQWLGRYRHSSSFYNLNEDIKKTYLINVKLAFIFVAIREAVKGWAVAVKQLNTKVENISQTDEPLKMEKEFILDLYQDRGNDTSSTNIAEQEQGLVIRPDSVLEKNLYVDYLKINQRDFFSVIRQPSYLLLRVQCEKIVLGSIALLPHPILSPINIVLELTGKYRNFPDLIYLLAEHFPTYAMQRMMFGADLIPVRP